MRDNIVTHDQNTPNRHCYFFYILNPIPPCLWCQEGLFFCMIFYTLKHIKIKPERLGKRQPDNRFTDFQAVQVPILNRLAVAFFLDNLIIKPLIFFQYNVFAE